VAAMISVNKPRLKLQAIETTPDRFNMILIPLARTSFLRRNNFKTAGLGQQASMLNIAPQERVEQAGAAGTSHGRRSQIGISGRANPPHISS
jgi:hypothetical protein